MCVIAVSTGRTTGRGFEDLGAEHAPWPALLDVDEAERMRFLAARLTRGREAQVRLHDERRAGSARLAGAAEEVGQGRCDAGALRFDALLDDLPGLAGGRPDLDRAAAGLGAAQLRDVQHRFEQRADAGRDGG